MRRVCIDTNIWDTPRAIKLEKTLGEADAWRFLVRLWAWGIDSDCESGIVELTPRRISQVSGFGGDPVFFVNALVACNFLKQTETGSFYMCGWLEKYKRYFSEKVRLKQVDSDRKERRRIESERKKSYASVRKQREKIATRGTTQIPRVDPCVSSSSSSVLTEPLSLSTQTEKIEYEKAKQAARLSFSAAPEFPISTPEDFEVLARQSWRWDYSRCKLKDIQRKELVEMLSQNAMTVEEADLVQRLSVDDNSPWVNMAVHKLQDIRKPKRVMPFVKRETVRDVYESNIKAIEKYANRGDEPSIEEIALQLDIQAGRVPKTAGGSHV